MAINKFSKAKAKNQVEANNNKFSEESLGISDSELHRFIINNVKDLISVLDNQGKFLFASSSYEHILGLPTNAIVGRNLSEFIHPEDAKRILKLLADCQDKANKTTIVRLKHQDGHYVHIEGSASSLKFKNGHIRILTVLRDISDRKKAEEQLRLYKEIVLASEDGIGITDATGHYLKQNQAHRKLLGYRDEELIGHTPAIHLGNDVFGRVVAALQSKGVYRADVKSRSKHGRELDIDLTAFAVKDDSGQVLCYVGIKRDVSERKRGEQKLRDANKRITRLLEGLLGPSSGH